MWIYIIKKRGLLRLTIEKVIILLVGTANIYSPKKIPKNKSKKNENTVEKKVTIKSYPQFVHTLNSIFLGGEWKDNEQK